MINANQALAAVLQSLEVSEATYHRWRLQYGGMKSEEAKWLKQLEEETRRLKQIVADRELAFGSVDRIAISLMIWLPMSCSKPLKSAQRYGSAPMPLIVVRRR